MRPIYEVFKGRHGWYVFNTKTGSKQHCKSKREAVDLAHYLEHCARQNAKARETK